jgi:peptide/nickel transport system substrate-binding protein
MRNPKLADKRVRHALAHVVDADEIIDELYMGFGERIASPVSLASPDYNKNLKPVPFSIEKAKQLLASAGWKDSNNNGIVDKVLDGKSTELSLNFLYTAGKEISEQLALLFQDNAKKAGIEIKIQAMEGKEILGHWASHDFELLSAGRGGLPIWSPEQNWHTNSDNRSGFGNAETDAIIDKIPVTFDPKKRRQMYYQLQEKILDEMPEIFLFAPKECVAIHKRFEAKAIDGVPGYAPAEFKLKK